MCSIYISDCQQYPLQLSSIPNSYNVTKYFEILINKHNQPRLDESERGLTNIFNKTDIKLPGNVEMASIKSEIQN